MGKNLHKVAFIALMSTITLLTPASALNHEDYPTLIQVVKDLQKKMVSGDPVATSILADLSIDGFLSMNSADGVNDYDQETLKEMVEKSYPSGGAHAAYVYGNCIKNGFLGFNKNTEEGLKIIDLAVPKLKELAEKNDAFACLHLYHIYMYGQSSEPANANEAAKWLGKGKDLNNPFCLFYAVKYILFYQSDDQAAVNFSLQAIEKFRTYFRFPREKVRELYRDAITTNFSKDKFEFVSCKSEDGVVTSLFKNKKLNYTICLIYKIIDNKNTLNKSPIIVFSYNNPRFEDDLTFAINMQTLNNFLGSWEKIQEWTKKIYEISPPAFSKCVNLDKVKNENPIYLTWDGKSQICLEEGTYQSQVQIINGTPQESSGEFKARIVETLKNVKFCIDALLYIGNSDNDIHSFRKTIQNALNNHSNSQKQINDNFK